MSIKYDDKGNIKYQGRLGKKMDPKTYSVTDKGTLRRESMEKLYELMELFEIDSNSSASWLSLAFALANEHVPGFQFKHLKNKGGCPRKKTISTDRELYLDVYNKAKNSGKNISDTSRFLLKNYPQYSSGKSLNTRYSEIKKKLKDDPEYKSQFLNAGIINSIILKNKID